METIDTVEIRVRFVRSDQSIMDGRFRGEVFNPSIDVKSPEDFEHEVILLVDDCSSKKT